MQPRGFAQVEKAKSCDPIPLALPGETQLAHSENLGTHSQYRLLVLQRSCDCKPRELQNLKKALNGVLLAAGI
jgi:hypothetical protein